MAVAALIGFLETLVPAGMLHELHCLWELRCACARRLGNAKGRVPIASAGHAQRATLLGALAALAMPNRSTRKELGGRIYRIDGGLQKFLCAILLIV